MSGMEFWKIYLIALAFVSFVTFCAYAVDKGKAKRGEWRISEKVLLLLSFFGGALGGCCAMHLVRHKTKKWYFHFVNLLGLVWQAGVLYLLVSPNIL